MRRRRRRPPGRQYPRGVVTQATPRPCLPEAYGVFETAGPGRILKVYLRSAMSPRGPFADSSGETPTGLSEQLDTAVRAAMEEVPIPPSRR